MFDIKFYQKAAVMKKQLMGGQKFDKDYLFNEFESYRSTIPLVYNIETTNACNMRCVMCPRTTMMTRPIETMEMDSFEKIAGQIKPFSDREWQEWEDFCLQYYSIPKDDMSENHFFLYIIPKVVVLHGYGDPLLDGLMSERVAMLARQGVPTYFSCNPTNINIKKTCELFEHGLGFIKFSIESVSDVGHKEIRGQASDFTQSSRKVLELLKIKKAHGYKTTIVITMLDLGGSLRQEEFQQLKDYFSGYDVYIYLKSQDQKWYGQARQETRSLHWIELCQFPWSSMTIKSDGQAAMCVEDFNNEIILGHTKKESLYDIWNGRKYAEFRKTHFNLDKKNKCNMSCDMKLIGTLAHKGSVS